MGMGPNPALQLTEESAMDRTKVARRLLYVAAGLIIISVVSFVLKGLTSPQVDDFMELHQEGGVGITVPMLFSMCGKTLFLIEPGDENITIYAGEEIADLMGGNPGASFLRNDLAAAFPDIIDCDRMDDQTRDVEPHTIDIIPFGPAPPGYLWSA